MKADKSGDLTNEDIRMLTEAIPTPFLLISENTVHRNIRRIRDYANQHGFSVRAHIKTHK